ncbi:MAG TPA: hypothetical protein VIC51_11090 [Psychromonas sp.]
MKLQLPKGADIKSMEFHLSREDAAKLHSELYSMGELECRVIEIKGNNYAIDSVSFEFQSPLTDSLIFKPDHPKVKASISLYKLKGEDNEQSYK